MFVSALDLKCLFGKALKIVFMINSRETQPNNFPKHSQFSFYASVIKNAIVLELDLVQSGLQTVVTYYLTTVNSAVLIF